MQLELVDGRCGSLFVQPQIVNIISIRLRWFRGLKEFATGSKRGHCDIIWKCFTFEIVLRMLSGTLAEHAGRGH